MYVSRRYIIISYPDPYTVIISLVSGAAVCWRSWHGWEQQSSASGSEMVCVDFSTNGINLSSPSPVAFLGGPQHVHARRASKSSGELGFCGPHSPPWDPLASARTAESLWHQGPVCTCCQRSPKLSAWSCRIVMDYRIVAVANSTKACGSSKVIVNNTLISIWHDMVMLVLHDLLMMLLNISQLSSHNVWFRKLFPANNL